MSPHTDAGALLKRTPEQSFDGLILEADWADMHGGGHHDENCEVCRDIANVRAALRQAASLGRAGGEAVAWRWRIKNSEGQHGGWEFSFTEPKFYGTPHDCEPLYALSSPVKTGGETET